MAQDPTEIHRKALRAAAAVAFGVSGCTEPVATVQGSPAGAQVAATDSALETDAAGGADGGSLDAVSAETAAADAGIAADAAQAEATPDSATSADSAAEIVQTIDAGAVAETAAAADAAGKPDCSKVQQGGDWAKCCDELRAWCDAAFGTGSQASTECQFGPNFNGSTGCTPWGPPAPPAWPRAVA